MQPTEEKRAARPMEWIVPNPSPQRPVGVPAPASQSPYLVPGCDANENPAAPLLPRQVAAFSDKAPVRTVAPKAPLDSQKSAVRAARQAKLGEVATHTYNVDGAGFVSWGTANLAGAADTAATMIGVPPPPELPQALTADGLSFPAADITATAASNLANIGAYREAGARRTAAEERLRDTGRGAFDLANAASDQRRAKGNLMRGAPGFTRDVVGGSVGEASRLKAVAVGVSLFGNDAGVAPDVAFGGVSCVTYVVAGAAQSRKVDKDVDRTLGVEEWMRRAATRRQPEGLNKTQAMRDLDRRFELDEISPNVYEALRARPQADVEAFLRKWDALNPQGRERLAELLHFGVGHDFARAMDMTRKTNLNTASVRRMAREAVIDAFLSDDARTIDPHLFDRLKTARREALGAKVAPGVGALEQKLRDNQITPEELGPNLVRAIAVSGRSDDFIKRYRELREAGSADEVLKVFHFDSFRFWKRDATMPTTKYQRSDIRAALVKKFADGMPLDRLTAMKDRYNQKVVPLRAVRTHSSPSADNAVIEFVRASQHTRLYALKDEKRDAKVKIAYGLANGAAAAAESVVNPGAVTGVSIVRPILSAPYLFYAANRWLNGFMSRRHSARVTNEMREDALLLVLPDVKSEIDQRIRSGNLISGLQNPDAFLQELGLSKSAIRKVKALEKDEGKRSTLLTYLARKNPEASVLIALRHMAQRTPGGNIDSAYAGLKERKLALAACPSKAIEEIERRRVMRRARDIEERTGVRPSDEWLRDGIQREAAKRKRLYARDNPVLATRLFVDELLSEDENVAIAARNMLREFRFGEMEIVELDELARSGKRKEVAAALEQHLFGDNLRRRFSASKLSEAGRAKASRIVPGMALRPTTDEEPLTWRLELEQAGVSVVENIGTPGLDSMLHALQQHFSGKTDCSSSKARRQVMEARNEVLNRLRAANVDVDLDVMNSRQMIVAVAAEKFGKPGAKVLIKETNGDQLCWAVGNSSDKAAPAAVLAYDRKTNRTFALSM